MEQVHPKSWKDDQVKAVRSAIQQEKLCKLSDEAHGNELARLGSGHLLLPWVTGCAHGGFREAVNLQPKRFKGWGPGWLPTGVARAAINFEGAGFGGFDISYKLHWLFRMPKS